jgi:hypothetical protein
MQAQLHKLAQAPLGRFAVKPAAPDWARFLYLTGFLSVGCGCCVDAVVTTAFASFGVRKRRALQHCHTGLSTQRCL